jgi:uncharacterized protein (TIRG00374 family)
LPAPPGRSLRQKLGMVFRAAVSVALLVYLILVSVPEGDRAQILAAYLECNLWWILAGAGLVLVDRTLSAYKWLMLLRKRAPGLRAKPVIEIFFVSTFLGYLLPSSIGGDALRAFSMGRLNRDLAGSASSVVLDRALGTLSLLAIAAVAMLPVIGGAVTTWEVLLTWLVTLAAAVIVLVLISRRCHRWISDKAGLERGGRFRSALGKLTRSFEECIGDKMLLVRVFVFSLGVQVLRVLLVVCLGYSLGLDVSLWDYFIYVPIITVLTFLPISMAGVGVREVGFVYFFSRLGIPNAACISLSLLYFTIGLVATFPGAAIYAVSGMGKKAEANWTAKKQS